ncbi:TPA: superinfection immunity protein [Escherichia coli]|uniref:superinfection immunity protein n=1 Tax=Escherichia coli TaxID=562 RepID=UPI0002243767|nr:superinfection immunity protein [Escherichia coli]EES3796554.1 superinfection immunity protein [Escherichia coli]EFC9842896.1 superinfection immunity protein [Escherichia coli]EFG2177001.1 superinfection immunity protein [Escherichia coli]EFJ5712512.1 superinfection immunity protein [Escherichia coli]EFK1930347.1 superinfection immunity protein [Escherichia coli]
MEIFTWIVALYIWLMANPLASIILYVIPLIIALMRGHKSCTMVVILNVLFGWIFLMWIILILWAAFGDKKPKDIQSNEAP